jgi:hypothetical protein
VSKALVKSQKMLTANFLLFCINNLLVRLYIANSVELFSLNPGKPGGAEIKWDTSAVGLC